MPTFAYLRGLPLRARKNLFCSCLRLTVTPLQSCLCCSNSRLFCSNCACCCSPVHFRVSSLCFTIYGHSSTSDSHNLIWRKPTEKCRLPLSITCSQSHTLRKTICSRRLRNLGFKIYVILWFSFLREMQIIFLVGYKICNIALDCNVGLFNYKFW